ncbi:MAG: hypothetical protein AAGJ81_13330 [Verrucomicrobiota bacterium]
MSVRIGLSFSIGLFLLSACSQQTDELREFAETYLEFHDDQNIDGLIGLIAIKQGGPEVFEKIRFAFYEETQWPLQDIQVEPLTDSEKKVLQPSLPGEPAWRVFIVLDTEDRFTSEWIAGYVNGQLKLLLPGEKE